MKNIGNSIRERLTQPRTTYESGRQKYNRSSQVMVNNAEYDNANMKTWFENKNIMWEFVLSRIMLSYVPMGLSIRAMGLRGKASRDAMV